MDKITTLKNEIDKLNSEIENLQNGFKLDIRDAFYEIFDDYNCEIVENDYTFFIKIYTSYSEISNVINIFKENVRYKEYLGNVELSLLTLHLNNTSTTCFKNIEEVVIDDFLNKIVDDQERYINSYFNDGEEFETNDNDRVLFTFSLQPIEFERNT